jgi:hypothetical protein
MSGRVGVTYQVQPQPWDESCTRWVPAGPLRIGVEWRDVDPQALLATYGEGTSDMAEIVEKSPAGGFYDKGVSLHVCAVEPAHEFLRFDVFDDDPHYHYIHAGDEIVNNVIDFDVLAHGEMLPWVIERLRHRLPEMLPHANGGHLVAQIDQAALDAVIDRIETIAVTAQADVRAARAARPPE